MACYRNRNSYKGNTLNKIQSFKLKTNSNENFFLSLVNYHLFWFAAKC